MRFRFAHPELDARDCDACQSWLLTTTGEIQRDRYGDPIPNPAPPDCWSLCYREADLSDRSDSSDPSDLPPGALKPRLTPENEDILALWDACRRHRCLPAAGGLEDQDPWLMACFDALWELWEARESAQRDALASVAPILGLLTPRL